MSDSGQWVPTPEQSEDIRQGLKELDSGPRLTFDEAKEVVKSDVRIGDEMPDGTVFAGVSPDTGKPMYATPADAKLTYTFNQAQKYAAGLDAHGRQDWRVPTKSELNVLFQNRTAIGGFNETGSYPAGWYWSSTQSFNDNAWPQRLSDGYQLINFKVNDSSLRCVRG